MNKGEAVVLDNLLSEELVQHIRDMLLSEDFPWYWNERTLEEGDSTDYTKTTHQFTHTFWVKGRENSSSGYIPVEIVRAVEARLGIRARYISRAKANLLCTLGDVDVDQQHEIHTDLTAGERVYSVVYYVGDSDGDTVIFSEGGAEAVKAQHKSNSAVVFNSLSSHRGTLPRKHKRRVVINIVFQAAGHD